ncbi:MAG: hypothetical protein JO264_10310 [Acidisphaera sp.]|nr:hypothetical protein [Acidisphaera sp.]
MATIVVALEEFSASTLSSALRHAAVGGDRDIAEYGAFADFVGALDEPDILVTHKNLLHLARQCEESPGKLRLIYLRPGVVLLRDLFGAIGGSADPALSFRLRLLDYLDGVFSRHPTVSLEELHRRPAKAAEALSNLLGRRIDAASLRWPGGDDYSWIVQRLLQAFGLHRAAPQDFPGFALGFAYSITGAGRLALERGWSYPEQSFIWSDGPSASLLLPLPATSRDGLRCRLAGYVAGGAVRVSASIAERVLADRTFDPVEPRELIIDVPIIAADGADHNGGLVRLDMAFENTVCPREIGLGDDPRRVGYALQSIMLYRDGEEGEGRHEAEVALLGDLASQLRAEGCLRVPTALIDRAGTDGGTMPPPALVSSLRRLAAGRQDVTVLADIGEDADALPVIVRLRSELGDMATLVISCGGSVLEAAARRMASEQFAAASPAEASAILLLAEPPRRVLEALGERNRRVALAVAWSPEQFARITEALGDVAQGRYTETVNLLLMTRAESVTPESRRFIEQHASIVELAEDTMLATARSA